MTNAVVFVKKSHEPVSRLMSLILRHDPGRFGLQLDAQGWANVDALIVAIKRAGRQEERGVIEEVVFTNDKQRFAFSEDGQCIRASQGHSVDIDLGLEPSEPPALLYHGTATRFLASIRNLGLLKGQRRHVHLSAERETALKVGQRHGIPVVLVVDTPAVQAQGLKFFISDNGVWLTEHVPAGCIEFSSED